MKLPHIIGGVEADDTDTRLIAELLRASSIGGGEPTTGDYTGTKALMLALLEDGLRALLDTNDRVSDEAARWMTSHRDAWVFSFATVCQTLGLDPDAVWQAARRMKANSLSARGVIGRNRPNVRRSGRVSLGRRAPSKGRTSA